MANIKTLIEKKRACGYRKPGGLYLTGSYFFSSCCKLPFELSVCPCCGKGIKFSRGFTWIESALFCDEGCLRNDNNCAIAHPGLKMGLMWVGERFYKTERAFINEALNIGISKRIARVPKGCIPGHTWIALAHKKAVIKGYPFYKESQILFAPGVFAVFGLQAIQYVITGKESDEYLNRLENRGIECVHVIKEGEQQKFIL